MKNFIYEILFVAGLIVIAWFGYGFFSHSSSTNNYYDANGISFSYPLKYKLESRADSFENKPITVLTLIDKNVTIPDMSEGPPAISLIAIPNPEHMDLEAWVRTKSISNFYLSSDKKLASTTVAGEKAFRYSHTGLYESDAVAVLHQGTIYVFSVGWADANDPIRTDFLNLVSGVQFK